MLKVGDKVKVKGEHTISGLKYNGKIGTITKIGNVGPHADGRLGHYALLDIEEKPTGIYFYELELLKERSMSKVNYHLFADSVILNHEGKTTTIRRGDVRFDQVVQAIRENRLTEIPELVDTENAFARLGLALTDGRLHMDGSALPQSLSNRILALMEAQMPVDIFVRFWQNLKQNPSFNSREMLYKFLEHNGHPLTDDGCFIAYRGVTEDFKDCHTKTFDNSVGSICEVLRQDVDDNPNNTCSHGLHVACHNYAKGFGPRLIEVKVNPKDVVAVPTDYNGTKMRVCRFEVVAEGKEELQGPVYKAEEVKAKIEEEKKSKVHNLRGPDGKFVSKKQMEEVAKEVVAEDLEDEDDYYDSNCYGDDYYDSY